MLENDTKLVVEENNMLMQQIEVLNEEIERAEEQENSLVRIKDLYKDQIKKLIKKNEENSKAYEEQLQK